MRQTIKSHKERLERLWNNNKPLDIFVDERTFENFNTKTLESLNDIEDLYSKITKQYTMAQALTYSVEEANNSDAFKTTKNLPNTNKIQVKKTTTTDVSAPTIPTTNIPKTITTLIDPIQDRECKYLLFINNIL